MRRERLLTCPHQQELLAMPDACDHVNTYQDHLQGHWHCDDCGAYFGSEKPEAKDA